MSKRLKRRLAELADRSDRRGMHLIRAPRVQLLAVLATPPGWRIVDSNPPQPPRSAA